MLREIKAPRRGPSHWQRRGPSSWHCQWHRRRCAAVPLHQSADYEFEYAHPGTTVRYYAGLVTYVTLPLRLHSGSEPLGLPAAYATASGT